MWVCELGGSYKVGYLIVCEIFKYAPIESEDTGIFTTKMVSDGRETLHLFDH